GRRRATRHDGGEPACRAPYGSPTAGRTDEITRGTTTPVRRTVAASGRSGTVNFRGGSEMRAAHAPVQLSHLEGTTRAVTSTHPLAQPEHPRPRRRRSDDSHHAAPSP